jgi:hypothetical protein
MKIDKKEEIKVSFENKVITATFALSNCIANKVYIVNIVM